MVLQAESHYICIPEHLENRKLDNAIIDIDIKRYFKIIVRKATRNKFCKLYIDLHDHFWGNPSLVFSFLLLLILVTHAKNGQKYCEILVQNLSIQTQNFFDPSP